MSPTDAKFVIKSWMLAEAFILVQKEVIVLPLALFRANDAPHMALHEFARIVEGMNTIWRPARIQFTVVHVSDTDMPLWPNPNRQTDPNIIHGFYGHWESSPNGKSYRPNGKLQYMVRDHTILPWSPSLERVSAHEVGHLLKLPDYETPKGYLMTQGDAGLAFQPHEVVDAYDEASRIASAPASS